MTSEGRDPREQLSYFVPSPSSPWQWTKDGTVIVWYDGSTVAFREEIASILHELAVDGLPPFGGIVLMLAALKGKIPDGSWMLGPAVLEEVTSVEDVGGLRRRMSVRIERALDELADVVATLSLQEIPDLQRPKGKAALAETLFSDEPRTCSPDEARQLIDDLESGALEGSGWMRPSWRSASRLLHDVEALGRGWRRFDARAFTLRLHTGLEELPRDADMDDIAASVKARRLLTEIDNDDGFGGLAKLTRDLMAAIYLPHRVLPRDEAPSGGFADISNRGSLDRLLLSELAHDDVTLSVRVALNEALYVKREPPGEKPEGKFSILIDTGIRLWGVPRVYATAVALALVAVQSRKRDVAVYRVRGSHVEPVDLLTREGLSEHLSVLSTDLHPGYGLAEMVSRQNQDSGDETVVITEADAIVDPEFRACMRTQRIDKLYLASVERSGRFRLLEYPTLDGKPLSDATLDLGDVLPSQRTGSAPIVSANYDPDLPVILAVRPFPFLFPIRGRVQHVVNDANGEGACVMRDGRLFVWSGRRHGARQLTAELPRGKTVLLERTESGIVVVKKQTTHVRLVTITMGGDMGTVELPLTSELLGARYEAGAVLLIQARGIQALDPRTGERLSALDTGDLLWARGRYFAGNGWHAAAWDGVSLTLVRVPIEGVVPEEVIQVFDSTAHEGPLVLARGSGVRKATGEMLLAGDVSFVEGISSNGNRVLATASDGMFLCFDLETLESRKVMGPPGRWLDARDSYVPTRTLRRRFTHVTATFDGRIELRSAKGQWLGMNVPTTGGGIQLTPRRHGAAGSTVAFAAKRISKRFGCDLSEAMWDDGTRAFWDSRGLLHLKSSDPEVEEVSLIVGEWEVAAWCSDGTVCGPEFFTGRGADTDSPEAMLEKIARVVRRIA